MSKCAKDHVVLDITWQDALRHYGGKGYYPTTYGKWKTKITKGDKQISLGYYDTPEDAAEAIYQFRANKLKNALAAYGLNPDDGYITANRHLCFDNGKEFNLHGTCIVGGYVKKTDIDQTPKEKNRAIADNLNSEYIKRKAKDLLHKDRLRHELPKVGDKLRKRSLIPTILKNGGLDRRYPCVVTYVNRAHLWYEVEFNFGEDDFNKPIKWRESFKLPERTTAYN